MMRRADAGTVDWREAAARLRLAAVLYLAVGAAWLLVGFRLPHLAGVLLVLLLGIAVEALRGRRFGGASPLRAESRAARLGTACPEGGCAVAASRRAGR